MRKNLFVLIALAFTLTGAISPAIYNSATTEAQIGHGIAIFLVLSAGYSIARNFMLKKEEQES